MSSVVETNNQQTVLDSYPLASLQSAMLVNHLRAPRSGVDIVQMVSEMPEQVDVPALTAAWEHVSDRHPALRTAFRWENTEVPLQEVFGNVPPEVRVLDWTGRTLGQNESALREFLREDRVAGFDMRSPPLQRVTLIQFAANEWRMIWTFHHALIDGRSFAIVLREVMALYDARALAAQPSLPELVPIRRFAEWYDSRDFSETEEFWREQLRGFPAATPLPANVADANIADAAAGRGLHHRWLSKDASARLNELARANGLTINNIIQGAWALMLALHSGEDDVVFGATRACRKGTIAGADDMVGLFINTVPVRVRINREQPLVEWLSALRETWRSLFAVEHTPLRLIQRWSDVGAGEPLFNCQIVFESMPLKETMHALEPSLRSRGFQLYGGTNFPLTGLLYGGERFSLEVEHDRSVISDATAIRFIEQLSVLLESMAEHGHAPVGELNLLPAAERSIVVEQWNQTDVDFGTEDTLVSLMDRQAARTPNAIAVRDASRSLSYSELHARAEMLARELRSHGVTRDTLVAVSADRSVELVIALVAVLKAGGAYVPLDPEYPSDRLAFMLEDAAAPVLLAHKHVAHALPPHNAQVIWLDDVMHADVSAANDATPLPTPGPRDLAYMIYTSGSTGRPKGALNEHRGIVNRLLWMQKEYGLTSNDVVLQKTPFSFDVSVWEFFWPLLSGATLVMAKPGGHRDAGYLAEVMQAERVSVCHFVPSMLRAFLANKNAASCTTLRDVMASGEALAPDLAATFARTLPHARLHNLYGPTECAVDVSYWPCPQAETELSVVPIGRPVANTQLYVLDVLQRPVPIGVAGELFLAGIQVGRGYHNRADLTSERFVPNPFAHDHDARMYRTGDRARWRADGTVEYLGRLDFQVKIRGFRIELGEIESALLAHASIRDVVVVSNGTGDSQRLVAYVVAEGNTPPSLAALRTHLMTTLPEYMVPALFVWLPALPLSSNGKVDRRALPDPGVQRESLSRAYVAPRNDRERLLANLWCRVLRLDSVGVEDNFFELGGDSLLGVQILASAAQNGLRLSLTQLLRHPTIAVLASLAESTAAAAVAAEVTGDVPLTPVQQWFFETQKGARNHWNQALMLTAPADIDVNTLELAFDAVVRHHDSFRTQFVQSGDAFTQRLTASSNRFRVQVTDIAALPAESREQAIANACEQVESSFSLDSAPLLAAGLLRLGADVPTRLLIAAHHLVIDGVSWRILVEDLETAYQQLSRSETVVLPAGTTPFSAWASELALPEVQEKMQGDLPYWESAGAASTVRLPNRGTSDTGLARDTETVVVRLSDEETRALFQDVPAAYNTQINDVLLSALADALGSWAGKGELVVNVEGHGREDVVRHADVSRTTGWFTTIYPVRLSLDAMAVGERIKSTKELLRGAPHRGLSYGVLRYLNEAATLRTQPTPGVVFNYLGQFDQIVHNSSMFAFAHESTGSWYGADTARPHALEINALTLGGTLEVRWSYNRHANSKNEIEETAATFAARLREIVSHCTAPGAGGFTPSDFPLASLTQASVDKLAAVYPDVESVYPLTPMQELFLGATDPGTDPGFEQWRYRLSGSLDVTALRAAWQLVTTRHAMLRTAFVSEGLTRPMQVVLSDVELPFAQHDLRDVPHSEQSANIQKILEADRAQGFAIDRAPLMRITLIRLADSEFELVWSNHHLLLDRWSWPLILLEVQQAYPALASGKAHGLADAARFEDFVSWQQAQQNTGSAREFWAHHFTGYEPPPRLSMAHADAGNGESAEVVSRLSTEETAALHSFARSQQVAPNAVIAAAWTLCLARRSAHLDVSCGIAVSGRDATVSGIERLVGLTMNNLPLRSRLMPDAPAGSWLAQVHNAQTEIQQFAYVPLASIQEWSQVPWRHRLFETLLVFQHDDAEEKTGSWLGDSVATTLVHVPTRTAYPLSVMVAGRDSIEFRITFDDRFFNAAEASAMAEALAVATKAVITNGSAPVAELLASLPELSVAGQALGSRPPHTAPRTATEKVLARIWGEIFDVGPVGVHDNFFMLGGYSLVATQIVSRIRNTLKVDAAVRLLFQYPTVAELATALTAREMKPGQLERIAALVERVQGLSLDELRRANAARAQNT